MSWLTVKEMAELKGVSERAIRKAISQGKYSVREVEHPSRKDQKSYQIFYCESAEPTAELRNCGTNTAEPEKTESAEPTAELRNCGTNTAEPEKTESAEPTAELRNFDWGTAELEDKQSVELRNYNDELIDKKIEKKANCINPPKKEPVSDLPAFSSKGEMINKRKQSKGAYDLPAFSSDFVKINLYGRITRDRKTLSEVYQENDWHEIEIPSKIERKIERAVNMPQKVCSSCKYAELAHPMGVEKDKYGYIEKYCTLSLIKTKQLAIEINDRFGFDITKTVNKNILLKDSHSIPTKENSNLTKVTNCSPIMPGSYAILPALSSECVCSAEDNSNLPNCSTENTENSKLPICSTKELSNLPNCSTENSNLPKCSTNKKELVIAGIEENRPIPDLVADNYMKAEYEIIAKLRAAFCEKSLEIVKNNKNKASAWNTIQTAYDNDLLMSALKEKEGSKSIRTFQRWLKDYLDADRNYEVLLPKYPTKENNNRKVPDDIQNLIIREIKRANKIKLGSIISYLRGLERNRIIPKIECSDRTIIRWASEWMDKNKAVLVMMRDGEKAFRETINRTILRDRELVVPGICWIADGMKLDFEIIDPETGKPRRMILVVFYDWGSGMPVGMSIGATENTNLISDAFRNAVLNVGYVPKILYIDNGKAFRADFFHKKDLTEELSGLYERLGVSVIFANPYNGKAKNIERWFKTMQDGFERFMPAFRGTSIADQPAYLKRNEKWLRGHNDTTPPTIIEVMQMIDFYTYKIYGTKPQTGLKNRTPLSMLKSAVVEPERYKTPAELNYLMLTRKKMKMQNNGIYLGQFNLWYYDDSFINHVGEDVLIGYDLHDLRTIMVWDSRNRFIAQAPARELIHPLVTLSHDKEIDGEKLKNEIRDIKRIEKKHRQMASELNKQVEEKTSEITRKLLSTDLSDEEKQLKLFNNSPRIEYKKKERFEDLVQYVSKDAKELTINQESADEEIIPDIDLKSLGF